MKGVKGKEILYFPGSPKRRFYFKFSFFSQGHPNVCSCITPYPFKGVYVLFTFCKDKLAICNFHMLRMFVFNYVREWGPLSPRTQHGDEARDDGKATLLFYLPRFFRHDGHVKKVRHPYPGDMFYRQHHPKKSLTVHLGAVPTASISVSDVPW